MNTDESELALFRAERRVREIQAKLHRWADHDHSGTCGAPVARKRARRVREAARGNPPVETPAGRPGPTSRTHEHVHMQLHDAATEQVHAHAH